MKGEGNSINYTYRMHDPRICRFFAVDPLAEDYAWNSPYAFSANIVINAVELEGLENVYVYNVWYDGKGNRHCDYKYTYVDNNLKTDVNRVNVYDGNGNIKLVQFKDLEGNVKIAYGSVNDINSKQVAAKFNNNLTYLQATNEDGQATAVVYDETASYSNGGFYAEASAKFLEAEAHDQISGYTEKIGASATVAESEATIGYGSNDNNFYVNGKGTVGHANVEADGGIRNGSDGTYGFKSYAEVGAYLLKGEASFTGTINGMSAKFTVGGSVLSAHVGGGFDFYFDENEGQLHMVGFFHAGLGLGGKVGVDIIVPLDEITGKRN